MALMNCGECGREVSDKAAACPQCGAPIASPEPVSVDPKSHVRVTRTGGKWEGIGFVLIAGGLIASIAGSGGIGGAAMAVGFVLFIYGRFF